MAAGHSTSCGFPELLGMVFIALVNEQYKYLFLSSFSGCTDIRDRLLVDIKGHA